jgi:thiamine monophosphate synthase
LKELKNHITIPVAAIGGIGADNIQLVLDNGADVCAVMSGIIHGNIKENVNKYLSALDLN